MCSKSSLWAVSLSVCSTPCCLCLFTFLNASQSAKKRSLLPPLVASRWPPSALHTPAMASLPLPLRDFISPADSTTSAGCCGPAYCCWCRARFFPPISISASCSNGRTPTCTTYRWASPPPPSPATRPFPIPLGDTSSSGPISAFGCCPDPTTGMVAISGSARFSWPVAACIPSVAPRRAMPPLAPPQSDCSLPWR